MYDKKDLSKVGFHDYDKGSAESYAAWDVKSFSVNIFKWGLMANKKEMKQLKCVVRVLGKPENKEKVFQMCETIIKQLDLGEWDGRKTVSVS